MPRVRKGVQRGPVGPPAPPGLSALVGALVADAEQVACAESEVQSVDLGFGRIVGSESEAPDLLVTLVERG